jgi:hypothetical protein
MVKDWTETMLEFVGCYCLYISQDGSCFHVAVTRRMDKGMGAEGKESPSRNMRWLELLTRSKSNLCAAGRECRWKHISFFPSLYFCNFFFFVLASLFLKRRRVKQNQERSKPGNLPVKKIY